MVKTTLENAGWRVLINEVYSPVQFNGKLQILGLGDYWEEYRPYLSVVSDFLSLSPGVFKIVLSHNPDSAVDLQDKSIDLILTGHTHGGQYCLPPFIRELIPFVARLPDSLRSFIPRHGLLDVVKHWEWASGWTEFMSEGFSTRMYTNTGLTRSPVRFWCKAEVAIFTITENS